MCERHRKFIQQNNRRKFPKYWQTDGHSSREVFQNTEKPHKPLRMESKKGKLQEKCTKKHVKANPSP
jgi:hypothetical protein